MEPLKVTDSQIGSFEPDLIFLDQPGSISGFWTSLVQSPAFGPAWFILAKKSRGKKNFLKCPGFAPAPFLAKSKIRNFSLQASHEDTVQKSFLP